MQTNSLISKEVFLYIFFQYLLLICKHDFPGVDFYDYFLRVLLWTCLGKYDLCMYLLFKANNSKMERLYIESKTFEKADIPDMGLALGDYEDCTFNSCDLSNLNLSGFNFTECEFIRCNMSMAKLSDTTFNEVNFAECKLVALHFEDCNEFLFSVSFDQCQLTLSSFYKRKLKNTIFKKSTLQEVDFTEADLTGSVFDHCDLARLLLKIRYWKRPTSALPFIIPLTPSWTG